LPFTVSCSVRSLLHGDSAKEEGTKKERRKEEGKGRQATQMRHHCRSSSLADVEPSRLPGERKGTEKREGAREGTERPIDSSSSVTATMRFWASSSGEKKKEKGGERKGEDRKEGSIGAFRPDIFMIVRSRIYDMIGGEKKKRKGKRGEVDIPPRDTRPWFRIFSLNAVPADKKKRKEGKGKEEKRARGNSGSMTNSLSPHCRTSGKRGKEEGRKLERGRAHDPKMERRGKEVVE